MKKKENEAVKEKRTKEPKQKAVKEPKIKAKKEPKQKEPKQPKIKKPINKEGLIITIVVAVVVLLTAGIVLYYFCFANNEKVATYKNGEITRGEFELYYRRYAPYYVYYYGYSATTIIPEIAKQAAIDELLYEKAVKAGFKISDEDKKEIEDQFANKDNITSMQEQGFNIEELKAAYYKDAVVSEYMKDLESKVTTEQVKALIIEREGKEPDLNVYNTSHILLKFEDSMTDADKTTLKKKAETLLEKAKRGEDFAKLAKDNSDDSSKDDGGKVAVKKNGNVYQEYMDAVLTLKAGQVYSKVVETAAGYHVIKLNSIDKDGRLTDEEDISYCVNSEAYKILDNSNYEAKTERLTQLGTTLGTELGLISNQTQADTDTATE